MRTGVLLVNLGTPDSPTPAAIRRYLKQFLSDPRVIETPRFIWWFILNGIILPIRPQKLRHAYELIWQDGDSPIRTFSESQKLKLQEKLDQTSSNQQFFVEVGMTYGQPSLNNAIEKLNLSQLDQLLVLPLFPQYSATTTAASFDGLAKALKSQRNIPSIYFCKDYHQHPLYIQGLANTVRQHWQNSEQQGKLLLSFHGLPKQYVDKGDPYLAQCQKTARLLAEELQLQPQQWDLSFQSRVGFAQWLQPYTDDTLLKLGKNRCPQVDVLCPGFSVDCLETLEEIDQLNRTLFQDAGGGQFNYIAALNDNDDQIKLLQALVMQHLPQTPPQ